jgi:RHS repeat-associated protein
VNSLTADRYADNSFSRTNLTLVSGNNTFTAVGKDNFGRQDSQSITVNLPSTVTYTYDGNGNLTYDGNRAFDYDDENQLIRVTVTNTWKSEFTYDGKMRRRILKEFLWQNGGWAVSKEVHYVCGGSLVIQERDGNNVPTVTYTRGRDLSGTLQKAGGIGGLLARTDHSTITPQHAFYHADGNGNVTILVNGLQLAVAKYIYDPFGNILSKQGPVSDANLHRFSSKESHPSSGLSYYLYRYADVGLQRWLNRDPIQERGGLNLYAFVKNSPTIAIDPFGHDNPGCDVGQPSVNRDCYLRCCALHDKCFAQNNCNAWSWLLLIVPFNPCGACNRAVACCWASCLFGLDTAPGPMWYCPNGPHQGTMYFDWNSIPPDCWDNGVKPGEEPPST